MYHRVVEVPEQLWRNGPPRSALLVSPALPRLAGAAEQDRACGRLIAAAKMCIRSMSGRPAKATCLPSASGTVVA